MARSSSTRCRSAQSGFALVAVLLVLLSLLVLATPLLLSARGADQASTRLADRTETRIALDAAARHARVVLSDGYPSADLDRTPYYDGQDEVEVDNAFPQGFLDANDPLGAMWTVECRDVAGLIDMDSASPHVLSNLMGLSGRLGAVLAPDAKEIKLGSAGALEPEGFLWIEGETVQYRKIVDGVVVDFTRGVFGPGEGTEWRGGPRPAGAHGIGTPVLDQRALAPALWRLMSSDGELRSYESAERVPESAGFAYAAATDPAGLAVMRDALLRPLRLFASAHGGVRAGATWQRAARLTTKIVGGVDGRLRVDNARWLNPGATVRVTDGENSELALVQNVLGNGEIALDRIVRADYEPYEAVVEVLARRPVNLNTAPREVLQALFLNLQVAGQNSRVTADEAASLSELVIQSRPFTGFEDFLKRVVLPAAGIDKLPADAPLVPDMLREGEAFLDAQDAVAVYTNGLNANDASLAWSTMPYAFTTRDVYALELRAAINAPSGVQRYAAVRDDVNVIAPQRELIRLWARQEDFDDELRLGLEAPWWLTGPNATSRWDAGAVPPSRLWAQLGTFEGKTYMPGVSDDTAYASRDTPPSPERVFPSRTETAWAALMPTRLAETQKLTGRVEHFDHETRDPEGRYLPDQTFERAADDDMVRWNGKDAPFLRSSALSLWFRPKSLSDGRILDVGGASAEVDRMTLGLEGDDIVLRVLDGFGDHRDTRFEEFGELRYSVSTAPGLPADVWNHLEFDVRGNRPSQMHMLVNGLAHGVRTPGLTRLTGSVSQNSASLPVESVDGFPERCVVRIGNELIEVTVAAGALSAARIETGTYAGFGGRMAREQALELLEDAGSPPVNLATISTDHAAGTPVELFGYSLPIRSDVPSGEARLARDIGKFRVAMAVGVTGGDTPLGDVITVGLFGALAGTGSRGENSTVDGILLKCADDGDDTNTVTPPEEYMTAFHPDGGYAAIVQVQWTFNNGEFQDPNGSVLGGVEVIRYSGWSDSRLAIAERGIDRGTLPNLGELGNGQDRVIGGQRTFVVAWDDEAETGGPPGTSGLQIAPMLTWRTYVVPISFAVPGASDVRGFLAARKGNSQFAQVTHVSDAELTEWVRYDWFDSRRAQLVRDDPDALGLLYAALTRGVRLDANPQPPGPPPPPGGGGGGGVGGGGGGAVLGLLEPPAAGPSPPPLAPQTYATSQWDPRFGRNENVGADFPISRSAETRFQFRGVLGTWSHTHPANTPIHPVFEVDSKDVSGGRPGRQDAVFLVGSDPTHVGWPLIVHRAHVPAEHFQWLTWRQPPGANSRPRTMDARELAETESYLVGRTFVAFQTRSPENVAAGSAVDNEEIPTVDTRLLARLVCFPSGERPRAVTKVRIGGSPADPSGVVPAAVVDELAFGDAQFGRAAPDLDPESMCGASLVLSVDADETATELTVRPKAVRIALSDVGADREFLGDMPANGGLLRMGDEIVAYRSYDAQQGTIQLAQDGRGRLGTKPGAHETFDPVMYLEHRVSTVLTSGMGAGDSMLAVANVEGFPPDGLVIVGDELMHYTRIRGSALEMPRASSVPGFQDGRGEGLFRGRFGTTPATHASGDAVILFPVRYPDRWARRADAPELSYFGFGLDQPAAFWSSVFFAKQEVEGSRIGVLLRPDPSTPWDADPDTDPHLAVLWEGNQNGKPVPVGHQSDRLTARVFVEYLAGAFDARSGLQHGWRQTPRLTTFSAFYLAPNVTLRSVER